MNWMLLAGSLAAILFLAAAARWLGLGVAARIRSTEQAIALAEDVECGFDGTEAAVDRAGYAAIVRNAEGRQMLIRAHGNHFAGRLIGPGYHGRLNHTMLTLIPPEPTFGAVTMELGDAAPIWAARLREVMHA